MSRNSRVGGGGKDGVHGARREEVRDVDDCTPPQRQSNLEVTFLAVFLKDNGQARCYFTPWWMKIEQRS